MRMINAVNKYLYGELGYKGAEVYLDPDNSCINMVLKRREGITYLPG
jgi:regulator of sirC expression with transglutaminase-like and TPR domain